MRIGYWLALLFGLALPVLFTPAAAAQATKPAAAVGNYGAWAFSDGDMPSSISSGLGGTPAQAETAAVDACKAAGGGSGGSGNCYARAWFENAYSSFAYDASRGYWGESWAGTSARADSLALSYCGDRGATDCAIVARAQTPSPTGVAGELIQATPSYGVWAISPSTRVASWGTGDTRQAAQQAAIPNCKAAGGLASECSAYGAWVENGYSAIYMGANGTWSVSVAGSPADATNSARHECQTVKAVGLTCTLKGSGVTDDAWVAQNLGWIDQPIQVETLKVKSYSQNLVSNINEFCGPTSVAMVLDYYNKFSSSIGDNPTKQIENVLSQTPGGSVNGTVASDLEAALASSKGEYSPASYSELPEPLNIYDLATAIEQGHPVIAFVNANFLSPPRNYSGHWLVVTGFSVSAGVTNVLVNDPDQTSEGLPGADQPIPLSTFETAASHYAGFTSVAGIIVTR